MKDLAKIFLIAAMSLTLLFFAVQPGALGKDFSARIYFELPKQGAEAKVTQPLKITLEDLSSRETKCHLKLSAQAYTGVVASSLVEDFSIQPTELTIDALPVGVSIREVQISFAKDGEYRVFGEASTEGGFNAAEGYCFIVRDGKVYGARFFDDCEGVIIEQNMLKTRGNLDDIQEMRRQYQERMDQREQIKRNNRNNRDGSVFR